MVVWGGLSCPAGAGDGKQDLGRASRGRCCPANLPPGRREAPPPWLCLGFPGLLGLGCKPSTAWTHSPERLALQVLGYQHRSLENFISHACSCCSECCLLGSWQFNELLGIKNVSVLYPSAYFYGNPYLVETLELVMSGSNCKGNARASHRRGTSAAPEQSKSRRCPGISGGPLRRTLHFWGCMVWNFCNMPYTCYFTALLRHRLRAELCLEISNIAVLLSSLATHWKSHH